MDSRKGEKLMLMTESGHNTREGGETGRYEHPRRDRIYERPEYLPLGEESPR